MRRQRSGRAANLVLEGLETRTLLSGAPSAAALRAGQASLLARGEASLAGLSVGDHGTRIHQANSQGHDSAHRLGGAIPSVARKGAKGGHFTPAPVKNEDPLLDRLAEWDNSTQQFVPVTAGSVGTNNVPTKNNPTGVTDNVYVIAQGWMPGYIAWVQKMELDHPGKLPVSWETQNTTDPGPSTPWLWSPSMTEQSILSYTISSAGLADQIMAADKNATVLAYSWIDESATKNTLNDLDIPTQGYQSEAYTTMNGIRMAEAIEKALNPNYWEGLGRVHLIGHSHGARVATVAALALQQASLADLSDKNLGVVRQLTLLDTPESVGTTTIGASNFDWFYLAQLGLAQPGEQTGTVANSGTTGQVTGLTSTSGLSMGMGVTGPGIPAGTTITGISGTTGNGVVNLSATVAPSSGSPVTVGFWNWNNDAIFVDNYASWFGEPLNTYVVNDPALGINSNLKKVADIELSTYYLFYPTASGIALRHEYAANWYAGSEVTKGTIGQVGLLWSPLISSSSLPPPGQSYSVQTSSFPGPTSSNQFVLTPATPGVNDTATFQDAVITPDPASKGLVTTEKGLDGFTVNLSDASQAKSEFSGTFTSPNLTAGLSFDYNFLKATDGAQLQIWIGSTPPGKDTKLEWKLGFAITGTVANKPSLLPGSGHFTGTLGLASDQEGALHIKILLVKPANPPSGTTEVTISHFSTFHAT